MKEIYLERGYFQIIKNSKTAYEGKIDEEAKFLSPVYLKNYKNNNIIRIVSEQEELTKIKKMLEDEIKGRNDFLKDIYEQNEKQDFTNWLLEMEKQYGTE